MYFAADVEARRRLAEAAADWQPLSIEFLIVSSVSNLEA
jgi:hypothetical protein